ncbi:hypothetical protein [Arthrobacter sp. H5]|uniref:hypothetical protein n=1 Tax=Arthrobacter sp. H5 TaxID=1267973 RepID=UPI0004ACA234|nr:hypothetical protein [Arthrobacter sp. H5]
MAESDQLAVSRRRLRTSNIIRIGHGIRALAEVESELPQVAGAFSRITTSSAASHQTAGAIWDFPCYLCQEEQQVFHISRPEGSAAMRRPGVTGHECRLYENEIITVDGLNITTRERTWLDLAARLTIDDLVVIADHLVRIPRPRFEDRIDPYCTQSDLLRLLERHRGKRGIRKAREALDLCRVGADSPPETRLRLALIYAGLPEPQVNVPIMDADGNEYHEPDLSFPEYKVCVEYDGSTHSDEDQVERDISREESARRIDWMEIRISKRHMRNEAKPAVSKVRTALVGRGWRPDPHQGG